MWSKKLKRILSRKKQRPTLSVLIDPDKFNPEVVILGNKNPYVDIFFVGGSFLEHSNIHRCIRQIKKYTQKPVILFPGDESQISPLADGILFLSLVSGRNPEYLIEKQVKSAPIIQNYQLPFLPTAYLLIDGNNISTTEKITGTKALKQNKKDIYSTCLAAAMIGMQAIYLEAGSGAKKIIQPQIVEFIKQKLELPIIVGGGINSVQHIEKYISTKTDCIVIGNALEKNPLFLNDIKNYFQWK